MRAVGMSELLSNQQAAVVGVVRNLTINRALLLGLAANTTYFYTVVDGSTSTNTRNIQPNIRTGGRPAPAPPATINNFTTRAPHHANGNPPRSTEAVTFAVFGDLGVKEQEGANDTLARLFQHHARREIDAVLHVHGARFFEPRNCKAPPRHCGSRCC
jgi:hypothetical protein